MLAYLKALIPIVMLSDSPSDFFGLWGSYKTVVLVSPYWASEPACGILTLMWSFGPPFKEASV